MGADYHPAPIKYAWQHQPDAVLAQGAPVQNTWYPVLPVNPDCRVLSIGGGIGGVGETIEGRLTVDGVTILVTGIAFAAFTNYDVANNDTMSADFNWLAAGQAQFKAFLIEGQSVMFEIRKTTANGASTMTSRVKHALLLPT